MDYDKFYNEWNGKQVTAYGGECVALVAQYCVENGKPIAYANAKDWWNHPALTGAFDFITNNPNDYNQVPNRGDIMVWNGSLPGSGGYGHIAIYDGRISPGVFRSFDQNWGGASAHLVSHTYGYIIGWMRPKVVAPPAQGGSMSVFNNESEVKPFYMMLRGNEGTLGERQGWVGKDPKVFAPVALPEANSYRAAYAAAQAELKKINEAINAQNKVISDLTASSNATKAQYQEAVAKLAVLNADLTTAHDKIKDLENNPDTKLLNQGSGFVDWLKALFARITKKG